MSDRPSISRVTRPRRVAKTTYNRYSYLYDLIGGQFERSYTMIGLRMLNIQSGENVLEVGFGTGHALKTIANAVGVNGSAVGIDISERMCAITRRRLEQSGLSERVSLYCADAMRLPFEEAEFEALFMSFTLELFDTPEIPQVLRQCKRVLKPKGRIGLVSLSQSDGKPWIERLYEWVHKHFPQWVDCRPINPLTALRQTNFMVLEAKKQPMFGLTVNMITAVK